MKRLPTYKQAERAGNSGDVERCVQFDLDQWMLIRKMLIDEKVDKKDGKSALWRNGKAYEPQGETMALCHLSKFGCSDCPLLDRCQETYRTWVLKSDPNPTITALAKILRRLKENRISNENL
jgi:hypothetical protein